MTQAELKTITFTDEELNALVDAAEKIDGWVHVDPLESAVSKIVDSLNGMGEMVSDAINEAITRQENGTAVYYTNDEANAIMADVIDKSRVSSIKARILSIHETARLQVIGKALNQINAGKATLSIAGCDEWDIRIEYRK